ARANPLLFLWNAQIARRRRPGSRSPEKRMWQMSLLMMLGGLALIALYIAEQAKQTRKCLESMEALLESMADNSERQAQALDEMALNTRTACEIEERRERAERAERERDRAQREHDRLHRETERLRQQIASPRAEARRAS